MKKYQRLKVQLRVRVGRQEKADAEAPQIDSAAAVYKHLAEYSNADREVLLLLLVDAKNILLRIETHSIGAVDSAAVYPREIFRSVLLKNASSFIMVHNHPSGDPEPSLCDKEITRAVFAGAAAIGVKLLDHIILGAAGRYYSFADRGLIDEYGRMFSRDYSGIADPQAWVTP